MIRRLFNYLNRENICCEELMRRIEDMRELWKIEKRHNDALRDMEREERAERELGSKVKGPETRIVELLRSLQQGDPVDNCDTTHRFYLSGEQYDNESFHVQTMYRFCPRCGRFFNRELLNNRCYCDIE